MRSPIRIMSGDLASKIAAGEVVDRPSSAVKELIDNAVDAGARTVKIEIRDGGLKLIRITDDGCGIPREEVPLAFTSHATNKIGDLDDLEHLTTLGFRGEALPSIAAVARVELQTRAADSEVGTRYCVEYGSVIDEGICSTPQGVRISVLDLFANVPARRKFVRSLRAESGHIQAVVARYSLAQPDVQFTLVVDDRTAFHSPGTGQLGDAIAAVHGPQVLSSMLQIHGVDGEASVHGFISIPTLTRQNRTAISLFVNGRPIGNRSLAFALEEAYSGFLMIGRHPIAAIHLTVPSGDVDVNVHPAKSEVRFARDRNIHGMVHRTIANTLLESRLESRALTGGAMDITDIQETHEILPLLESDAPEPQPQPLLPGVPALRVFGQAHATFIIAEGPDGLYMIDQHAAHERVIFDRLDQQAADGDVQTQPMLEPAVVDLTPEQMIALDVNRDLLTECGFVLEPFGNTACLIRSIPVLTRGGEPGALVLEVLTELQLALDPGVARERALAAMACKSAVKAGQTLDVLEMRELVEQLERTVRPSTCPHGRPTMVHLSHSQLEREFGRR